MENGGVGGGGDVPENGNDHFLGTQSESAGKSEACAGCPNQQICASAPKGPDPVQYSVEHTACIQLRRFCWRWALLVIPFYFVILLSLWYRGYVQKILQFISC
ncbi:uncharacterized protein LOC133889204 isoform X1 [Phragmites australis]|uniref:uncharacterized protein LOC133889204 isoform X1 n=1 Tax=Phragmites australis TaxID=29695 RepID=UPI002D7945D5|nr:uncharacterized protein LOC133889204 isoform X1 [Phragmites australis]